MPSKNNISSNEEIALVIPEGLAHMGVISFFIGWGTVVVVCTTIMLLILFIIESFQRDDIVIVFGEIFGGMMVALIGAPMQ